MGTLRYSEGGVTVTLDGGLEAFVRKALDAAGGETVRILETAGAEVAAQSRTDWYAPGTGITRRTGKSGDVVTTTTVSEKEVRVRVGTTDVQKAKYVHRRRPLATDVVEITSSEYYYAKKAGGAAAKLVFRAKSDKKDRGVVADKWYRIVGAKDASDGKYLLQELIGKPTRRKVKEITPALGRAIAARIGK
jgi:hypothetical protein